MVRAAAWLSSSFILVLVGCGDDTPPDGGCPTAPARPALGDPTGHPQPLGSGPTEARAGRVRAEDLPAVPSGMATWAAGDFVLANDRVALVIEDVGDSDLYDPWGGRPVGVATIVDGRMVAPADFGELFLFTARMTVVTEEVSVIADGSTGGPAIVRATGRLRPVPFIDGLTAALFSNPLDDVVAAIDYELAPGAEHVDVRFRYASPRASATELAVTLHGLMYTKRMPSFVPGVGFSDDVSGADAIVLVDDVATSWAYLPAAPIGFGLAVSGFIGGTSTGFELPGCAASERAHAQLAIGASAPGLDGVLAAVAGLRGEAQRELTGVVSAAGQPVAGAHVHAIATSGDVYLSRASTGADGRYRLRVPADVEARVEVTSDGVPRGQAAAPIGASTIDVAVPTLARLHVSAASPSGTPLPVRIQVLDPAGTTATVPDHYGEPRRPRGRVAIAFATDGEHDLEVPAGTWEVVVSRGYEYDLFRQTITVGPGASATVDATLDRVVATPGQLCGDFHIHTARSNDSADSGLTKVASAVADGVELPVRSEHEYVADFGAEIAALGLEPWASGLGSIELTSMETWGHMGVFPLVPDPGAINAGAPRWQRFPTAAEPDGEIVTMSPVDVFAAVRTRAEQPVVIVNHPRGGANYFEYVGYDPATDSVDLVADWDTAFTLVEVFNDSDWASNRDGNVRDWLAILRGGRRVFAVGSSDSHGVASSPVGYPRTCIDLGTDDPRAVTGPMVRDRLAAGHAVVSGGVYVDARLGAARPGDVVTGLGSSASLDVEVRAAPWVDVDTLELVVDGVVVDSLTIMPGDADPQEPALRWRGSLPITVAPTGGFVLVAAFGDQALEPVHPGRRPFGVTNPIFVAP
ncbi:MAG: carboxypeptidase regulatory-like domain-containing protein [Kofleriaceae bacterium]|nr:carboxypeptidase regulatory-like domain-containing protein [Kofleriaceae bacterium]MBP6836477.1 carboxypeptidase regulatory-like domain-containing protein [Kofleriaceae bacterium]MBP9206771.1 carboxypeptidase regulatory-like domain-containing protein [Kofleriaceae bacterium]